MRFSETREAIFTKDIQALWKSSSEVDYDFKILNAVMEVNRLQKQFFIGKIDAFFQVI